MPGFLVLHYLPEFAQTHVHRVSDAIQQSHSLSSPSPPTFNFFQHQGLYQWVCSSYQVAKVLELQLQHESFQWIFRISFRKSWFDLLAVQGTLKSLLQHHNLKASILQCSAFFMVQLSHPYMTTWKSIALTIGIFVAKWCIYFLMCCLDLSWASLVAQVVKNPPAVWKTRVWSLFWEDSLEKTMATHSSILA